MTNREARRRNGLQWQGRVLMRDGAVYARIVHGRWGLLAEIEGDAEPEEFEDEPAARRWCEDRAREAPPDARENLR